MTPAEADEKKLVEAITSFASSATKLIDALTTIIEASVGDTLRQRAERIGNARPK